MPATRFHRTIAALIRRGRRLAGILAIGLAVAPASACEGLDAGAVPASAWVVRVGSDMRELPASCASVFAQITERLGTRGNTKVWIESVIDSDEASSLNIATLAGLTSRTEQALLDLGLTRWRVRVHDFRLPRRERSGREEIGRILIHIGEDRPVLPD